MKKYSIKYYGVIFGVIVSISGVPSLSIHSGDRSAIRKEGKADRRFINQNFDKAMDLYEKAIAKATTKQLQASLHAKSARLYYMLRRYPEATLHFENAMKLQKSSLTAEDVCNYMDALRFMGKNKLAEVVCLNYAFQSIYSRNQSFINSLEALSMRHTPSSDIEYEVRPAENCNTSGAEYWVGLLQGQVYFARSNNRFNDPGKRFFYDTRLLPLTESGKQKPADKKNESPFALFENGCKISTVIENRSKREIEIASGRVNPYITHLEISGGKRKDYDKNFISLFHQKKEFSYCHPFLFNNDRILLFASDAPGGYGGYDLYIVRWNVRMGQWDSPVNLGPEINTAGDEIYPSYYNGKLYFASNGQPGYGGYDLYSYDYDTEEEDFVPGSLIHLPAPINSVFNDFCLLAINDTKGYFISDRNLATSDDIFIYRQIQKDTKTANSYFGMSEQNVLLGGQTMLTGTLEKGRSYPVKTVNYPVETPKAPKPALTLYFAFNRTTLTSNSVNQLNQFINEKYGQQLLKLRICGYADDMVSNKQNKKLSLKRSETVADFLRRRIDIPMEVKGFGCVPSSSEEQNKTGLQKPKNTAILYNPEIPSVLPARSSVKRERVSAIRRVDIYINE